MGTSVGSSVRSMDKYVFVDYDPIYVTYFLEEKQRLYSILGKNTLVEHMGSTAVPGLGGKGIIDILVGVKALDDAKKLLEHAGYEFKEIASTPQRLFFKRNYGDTIHRRVHIHLITENPKESHEVAFRDWLCAHPEDLAKYAAIKREAVVHAKGEGELYRKYKEEIILQITKKACSRLQ